MSAAQEDNRNADQLRKAARGLEDMAEVHEGVIRDALAAEAKRLRERATALEIQMTLL